MISDLLIFDFKSRARVSDPLKRLREGVNVLHNEALNVETLHCNVYRAKRERFLAFRGFCQGLRAKSQGLVR